MLLQISHTTHAAQSNKTPLNSRLPTPCFHLTSAIPEQQQPSYTFIRLRTKLRFGGHIKTVSDILIKADIGLTCSHVLG